MPAPKDEEIKVRVTAETKRKIVALAAERGEAESVIIREAVAEYLDAREHGIGPSPEDVINKKKERGA